MTHWILGIISAFALAASFASARHERTVTVLSGEVMYYYISGDGYGGLALDLKMRIDPDDYEQLGRYDKCINGCRIRIHIVQVPEVGP